MKKCSVAGCEQKHRSRGLCDKHYQKWKYHRANGNPKKCSVTGCSARHHARGLCTRHYQRMNTHGTLLEPSTVCTITGCHKPVAAHQLCNVHYRRLSKWGDPLYVECETHGLSKIPEYAIWDMMIQRCYNPKNKRFNRYGARGISVCIEWRNSFSAFYRDMGPRPAGMTLDRMNNNAGYHKENCRWISRTENCQNTSTTRLNPEIVREIRAPKETGVVLARRFNVNTGTISCVRQNKTWRNI